MSGIVFVTPPPPSLSFQWLAGGFTVMLCSLSVMTFQDTGRYWKWYRKWASSETKLSALIGPLFITNKVADSYYAFIRCRQYVWILFHRELNFPSSDCQLWGFEWRVDNTAAQPDDRMTGWNQNSNAGSDLIEFGKSWRTITPIRRQILTKSKFRFICLLILTDISATRIFPKCANKQ